MTVLVSGNHRKTNDPKAPNAFFRRQRQRRKGTKRGKLSARSNAADSSTTSTPAHSGRLGLLRGNPAVSDPSVTVRDASYGSSRDRGGGIFSLLTGYKKTSSTSAGLSQVYHTSPAQDILNSGTDRNGGDGGGGGGSYSGGGSGRAHEAGVAPATPPSQAPSHAGSPMENTSPRDSSPSAGRDGELPEPPQFGSKTPWRALLPSPKVRRMMDAAGRKGSDRVTAFLLEKQK